MNLTGLVRLETMMGKIHDVFKERHPFEGVLLKLSKSIDPQAWSNLIIHLKSLHLRVMLEVHPDYEDLKGINLADVDGLVIRSATILPTGLRRDFFRGFELRDVLGRCTRQRNKRSNFVTILHDTCDKASTPTLRRGFKFARFHEALLYVCKPGMASVSQSLPYEEPYSAFDWLKRLDVLDLHRQWNEAIVMDSPDAAHIDLRALEKVFPGLDGALVRLPHERNLFDQTSVTCHPVNWQTAMPIRSSYFSVGMNGQLLSKNACFDLRDQITEDHVSAVVETQTHMRKLKLLHEESVYEKQEIHDRLTAFINHPLAQTSLSTIEIELVADLIASIEDTRIRVFRGLDSGFTLPESRFHIWSVFDNDEQGQSIYISQKASDIPATLLHTFLLSRAIPRRRCFEIELVLASSENLSQGLPPRLVSELKNATYAELLTYIQQISLCRDATCTILQNVTLFAQYLLVEETTKSAWKKIHGQKFLAEEVTPLQLYQTRIDWLSDHGHPEVPAVDSLVRMHQVVESTIVRALRRRDLATLDQITKVLCEVYSTPERIVDCEADLVGLMVFCAFRKYGVEETYLESSDRCPVYHFQKDQPGIFSELWVIGSQCEVYFDITPRELGAMHYTRYRSYLEANPPPDDCWNGKAVFTAYHKVENPTPEATMDGDPEVVNPFKAKSSVFFPRIQKFAFLSVFCLPAVCDVMLLVFLGRGVLQSAYMRSEEIIYGTLGLLTALLLSSGVIGWIGSSGGYYLYNSAFDSMCHVVVQRYSGGMALTLAVGVLGFLGIGSQQGWYSGLVFFLYLIVITNYLIMVGVLATMHRDGSPFPSGRFVLWKSIPVLLISPILTLFIHGYDFIIYMVVLYSFGLTLLYNFRSSCAEWSQWHTKVKTISDKDVLEWYRLDHPPAYNEEEEYEHARAALEAAVTRQHQSTGWLSSRSDRGELVQSLAPGLEYSRWLLVKDGGPGAEAPPPFSSAWNNSLKVSLNTYQLFIRGLKEHSAFLQWRYSKNDIAYNSVMFIAALLDRWVAITMSAAGDGPLNLYASPRNRFAIAFALSYFLISAVALDYQLQFCWTALAATSTERIVSLKHLDREESTELVRKRRLYWTSLRDLVVIMLFTFGFWSMILVLWVADTAQLIFFFAYCGSYTLVIWFQYNRVYIKNPTKAWLVIASAIAVGYSAGIVLHLLPATRNFRYIDVMCLALCNFLAGLWSFLAADFGPGRDEKEDDIHSPQALMNKTGWKTHSQKYLGLSAAQSARLVKANELLPRAAQVPTRLTREGHPEVVQRVYEILADAAPHRLLRGVFPNWADMLTDVADRWTHGLTTIDILPCEYFQSNEMGEASAIGRVNNGVLEISLPLPVITAEWIRSNLEDVAQRISEALVHETCEVTFSMPHRDAVLAELLLRSNVECSGRMVNQINSSSHREIQSVVNQTGPEISRHICLGVRPDVQWVYLPEDLRRYIVARMQCEAYEPNVLSSQWISTYLAARNSKVWTNTVQNCDTHLRLSLDIHRLARRAVENGTASSYAEGTTVAKVQTFEVPLVRRNDLKRRLFYGVGTFFKFLAVVLNGDPDVPRELIYSSRSSSFRAAGRIVILFFWRLCCYLRHFCIEVMLIHSRPELSEILFFCRKGVERRLYSDRVVIKDPFKPLTGFPASHVGVQQSIALNIYSGIHSQEPGLDTRVATAVYDDNERMIVLESVDKDIVKTTSTYQYVNGSRVPRVSFSDSSDHLTVQYDKYGRIVQGSREISDVHWNFEYIYSRDKKSSEILRARYHSMQKLRSHDVTVSWCIPRSNRADEGNISSWAPTQDVTKVSYTIDNERWQLQYTYHHKRDPTIKCIHEQGKTVTYLAEAPEWILRDQQKFFVKPTLCHFESEDLLFHHPPLKNWFRRWLHGYSWAPTRTVHAPISTGVLRSMLWSRWHKSKSLDGVTACYLDDQILRSESLLQSYWRARESGQLQKAIAYLDSKLELITARIEVDHSVCQNTFLPYKMSDMYTMGSGGSANVKTRKYEDNYADTEDRLSVMFLDTGCFPDQPGGVSNCRRDLVNGHTTIRNHVFTESANDFGVPRYQVDRNVQSVKVLPLWGLDYLSPYHGLFDNLLDSQVSQREQHTSEKDIELNFLPIFRTIIKGSRQEDLTLVDLAEYTQAFVDLSIYFEEKDYLKTWKSNSVKRTWRECWLRDQPGAVSVSTYFGLEKPTMAQFDEAMELWLRYFFVFSVKIPEEVPKVFQCTHHGVGSIFGMLLKLRRGTTYMIWDHAIYWRESCLNISSSQCILALSVQNMLLGVIRLASHLCYTHADVILPCTNQFNPGWEADIGSDSGRRQNKTAFYRKIDPVVNGISEMERFEPVDKIRSGNPTVMMLSNVQFIKDVKNAVLSADIIVNRFGFKKYQLVIYGALDRTPQYTAETEAIIKGRGLENNVKLAGFGNPKEILKDAWAFMNSSLSEGLPLAIGEAALSGAPVIATDVGATALVISDPKDPKIRYGEIVPPNDSVALARAQIQILSMSGPWAKYCGDDPPPMPEVFTTEDVDRITQRMYDKTDERRALGLKGRETVLHSFNGDRYLREHEQMYWIGGHRAKQRANKKLNDVSSALFKFDEALPIIPIISRPQSKLWDDDPWRYFNKKPGSIGRTRNYFQQTWHNATTKKRHQFPTELQRLSAPNNTSSESLIKIVSNYYQRGDHNSKNDEERMICSPVALQEVDSEKFNALISSRQASR